MEDQQEDADPFPVINRPRTTQPRLSIITLAGDNLRMFQLGLQAMEESDEDQTINADHDDDVQNDFVQVSSKFSQYRPTIKRSQQQQSQLPATRRRLSVSEQKIMKIVYGPEAEVDESDASGNDVEPPIPSEPDKEKTVMVLQPEHLQQQMIRFKSKSILKSAKMVSNGIERQPSTPNQPTGDSIGECSISIETGQGGTNVPTSHHSKNDQALRRRIVKLLSIIYAMLVVIVGLIITIGDVSSATNDLDHLYNIAITIIGLAFLIFLHVDVQRHKRFLLRWQESRKKIIESPLRNESAAGGGDGRRIECDSVSVTTTKIFNQVYLSQCESDTANGNVDDATRASLNAYRFLTGKHSGSFYLKIGMTLFCMGSIVHQGINLSFQIHYFSVGADECKNGISLFVYLLHCISAFYQLYIAFKYSNLIINRNHTLVRFGLMHMVGCSLSFWFSTIMEEAIHGYMDKIQSEDQNQTDIWLLKAYHHHKVCQNKTLADFESIDALPYFYPFSIEFNIIIASVWYIVWTNVENQDRSHSKVGHVQEEVNQDEQTGKVDIIYRSNVSINADCHASNLGMFGGLFSLLLIIISILIFFTTIKHDLYKTIGITVYTIQLTFLTVCCTVAIPLAYWRIRTLNVVRQLDSATNAMDDFLLVAPLPFYYVHHLLCIYSELKQGKVANSAVMAAGYAMNLVQVTCQTLFIIDGTRRCSNDHMKRKRKPGKQLITFAIIINVTLWILITFEIKSVDKYHSMPEMFGKFVWMIILDTCLPLILFYRFHSSVCLSEMWTYCYERDSH